MDFAQSRRSTKVGGCKDADVFGATKCTNSVSLVAARFEQSETEENSAGSRPKRRNWCSSGAFKVHFSVDRVFLPCGRLKKVLSFKTKELMCVVKITLETKTQKGRVLTRWYTKKDSPNNLKSFMSHTLYRRHRRRHR